MNESNLVQVHDLAADGSVHIVGIGCRRVRCKLGGTEFMLCWTSASPLIVFAPERFAFFVIVVVKISPLERRSVGDERKNLTRLIIVTKCVGKRRRLSAGCWVRGVGVTDFASITSCCFSIPD